LPFTDIEKLSFALSSVFCAASGGVESKAMERLKLLTCLLQMRDRGERRKRRPSLAAFFPSERAGGASAPLPAHQSPIQQLLTWSL
jgi:hypothetical protein